MKNAKVIVTDSGGIQEETTALQVPCITLRNSTERPITVEIGTNELVIPKKELIETALEKVLRGEFKKGIIPELWDGKAAERIRNIILELLKK